MQARNRARHYASQYARYPNYPAAADSETIDLVRKEMLQRRNPIIILHTNGARARLALFSCETIVGLFSFANDVISTNPFCITRAIQCLESDPSVARSPQEQHESFAALFRRCAHKNVYSHNLRSSSLEMEKNVSFLFFF